MPNIINTATGGIAFTDLNVPGNPNHGDEPQPAPVEHLEVHAKVMTTRAEELGIQARYEVAP